MRFHEEGIILVCVVRDLDCVEVERRSALIKTNACRQKSRLLLLVFVERDRSLMHAIRNGY